MVCHDGLSWFYPVVVSRLRVGFDRDGIVSRLWIGFGRVESKAEVILVIIYISVEMLCMHLTQNNDRTQCELSQVPIVLG